MQLERCVFGQGNELVNQLVNETLGCDELLYRAFTLYEGEGMETRASTVRAVLLDPKNALDQSKHALRLKDALKMRAFTRTPRCP